MVFNGDNNRFSQWMANGLVATVAWFLVLGVYCTFRAYGIEDPALGQAFLVLTGAWVGVLTLAQGKKQTKIEEAAQEARVGAAATDRKVERLTERVDESEARESEWSKHKDHEDGR